MSTHSEKKLKYPYRWGAGKVNQFVEKYARGLYFLAKMAEISPGLLRHHMVIAICSGNSLRWEAWKALVKRSEYQDFRDFRDMPPAVRRKYLTLEKYMAEDEALEAEFGDF